MPIWPGVVFVVLSIGLITWLLIRKHISDKVYAVLFLGILIAALAVVFSDRLIELNVKEGKLTLAEAQKVTKEVKKLGEVLADLAAYELAQGGRWGEARSKEEKIEGRNRLIDMLTGLESDEVTKSQVSLKINKSILVDLKKEVRKKLGEIITSIYPGIRQSELNKINEEIKELLFDNYDRAKLIDYLNQKGVYNDEVEPLLDKVDKFISDKTL